MNTAYHKTMNHSDFTVQDQYRQMALPHVPDAIYDEDHEGLLPLGVLNKPVRVEFAAWPGTYVGDIYQLLWNDALIGEIKTITTEQPGTPLFLEIPVEFLTEGVYAVAYRATNTQNNAHDDSSSVRIEIVTTPPGLPKLGPIKFPEEIDCGLTSAEFKGLGEQLVAEIGSYARIYQHDEIKTYWGDIEGPGAIVRKTAQGLDRIYVTFTKDFLLSLGHFDGLVTYAVIDRAGNVSQPSFGTRIQLLLDDTPESAKEPVPDDIARPVNYSNTIMDITLRLQSSMSTPSK